ncbi:uncharacterized protein LOC115629852 [Scaptodrosophila lebanonensis]|uniref:Uncharacterized protein LOC115629852 n=1 Tax=Drosophila lebanonensis TaxID=7225 RepID=A0A6J2U5B6_DROLE|nr:uncharacterized protein LOC115629852 [Scaptodrosophila lebanonensis]
MRALSNIVSITVLFLMVIGAVESNVGTVLKNLQDELHFKTLVLFFNSSDHCPASFDIKTLGVLHLITSEKGKHYLNAYVDRDVLVMVCLWQGLENHQLSALYDSLQHMRATPTLLLLRHNMLPVLKQLFTECLMHKMLNVIALVDNEDVLYSYRAFPHFEIRQKRLSAEGLYFESKLKDLGGHAIRTMPDRIWPRTVVYNDSNSQRKVGGYIATLIHTFADYLNATLDINWNEELLFQGQIVNLTTAGALDLPMCLFGGNFSELTYPIELAKWQLMLPVEPSVEINTLFFMVYEMNTHLLISVVMLLLMVLVWTMQGVDGVLRPFNCIDQVLRGFLAQSFVMPLTCPLLTPAIIHSLIAFSGLMLTNMYVAYLQMLFFQPPTTPEVTTYEGIRRTGHKIFLYDEELSLVKTTMGLDFWTANKDIFKITSSFTELQRLRGNLNTTFIYPITTSLWPMLKERQSKLKRPLFRVSPHFIWLHFVVFGLPVEENSIYKDPFNDYLSWIHATGLLSHWYRCAFFEMVQLGQLPSYQLEQDTTNRDMAWEDLVWIWAIFLVCCGLNCSVFLAELLYFRYVSKSAKASISQCLRG